MSVTSARRWRDHFAQGRARTIRGWGEGGTRSPAARAYREFVLGKILCRHARDTFKRSSTRAPATRANIVHTGHARRYCCTLYTDRARAPAELLLLLLSRCTLSVYGVSQQQRIKPPVTVANGHRTSTAAIRASQ